MDVPQHISSHITHSAQRNCTRMWSNPIIEIFSCVGHVEPSDISKLAQTLIVKCCLFTKIRAHVFKEYIIHIHTRITSWASRVRRNNVYISFKCFRFSHSTIVRLILFQPIKAVLKGRCEPRMTFLKPSTKQLDILLARARMHCDVKALQYQF